MELIGLVALAAFVILYWRRDVLRQRRDAARLAEEIKGFRAEEREEDERRERSEEERQRREATALRLAEDRQRTDFEAAVAQRGAFARKACEEKARTSYPDLVSADTIIAGWRAEIIEAGELMFQYNVEVFCDELEQVDLDDIPDIDAVPDLIAVYRIEDGVDGELPLFRYDRLSAIENEMNFTPLLQARAVKAEFQKLEALADAEARVEAEEAAVRTAALARVPVVRLD